MSDVAYIISHYPKVSHSFIRREIVALEKRGLRIMRFAMRGWQEPLVDPGDIDEREKTVFVLRAGKFPLLLAVFAAIFRSPDRFFDALMLAVRMARGADRPFVWHIIYLAEACWIAPHIRRHSIRHIHAHFGTNPTEVAALVSTLTGATYSFTVHGPEEFDKVFSVHLPTKVERSVFVAAISSYCRSQLFRITNYDAWSKIKVIHCGLDQAFTNLDHETPPSGNKLVCVGRLNEQKGQLLLIDAIYDLVVEFPEIELILVGDGELRAAIEELIARRGLQGTIRITGWASADQVKQHILDSRALVLPSFAEGLPVVVMEAMAMQRPVLTTMINGIPELVLDGENGWLFPAGDRESLKAAIRKCMLASPGQLHELGKAARERVLARHSSDRQAELLLEQFGRFLEIPAKQAVHEKPRDSLTHRVGNNV